MTSSFLNKKSSLALFFFLISLCAILYLFWNYSKRTIHIQGETMDSTYSIKVVLPRYHSKESVQHIVDTALKKYSQIFSTYDPNSEISRFNRSENGMEVSPEFIEVYLLGQKLYLWTKGSWDGTVLPLVDLWGFSTHDSTNRKVPPKEDIEKALAQVGYHQLTLNHNVLEKSSPTVTVSFSSIAPGYIADKIGDIFQALGATQIFIEIGGEVLAIGTRPDGKPWHVGINTPTPEAKLDDFFTIIPVQDQALATSGDYRNYFEADGTYYGHILNPHTGYPVQHRIVSVSVLAPTCGLADGIATAVVVLGRRNGLALIEGLDNVEAMIIEQAYDQGLEVHYSKGFPKPR